MIADLNFENYTLESFSCQANMDFKEEDTPEKKEGKIQLALNVKKKSGVPDYMIEMEIGLNKEEDSFRANPYRISMKILGFFTFKDGTDTKKMSAMVHLNGSAMLYGIARGIVAQITANGPHGRFLLPSVNIKEVLKAKVGLIESGEAPNPSSDKK